MGRLPPLLACLALLAGCVGPSAAPVEQPMGDSIQRGSIPEPLDQRVANRDQGALPEGALVRFQHINRGKNPARNYRWVLYDDGRLFLARNTGADLDGATPFDGALPDAPTATLPPEEVARIRAALADARLDQQPPYQEDERVEDGSYAIVTARLAGGTYEVIYAAYDPPLVQLLRSVATSYR